MRSRRPQPMAVTCAAVLLLPVPSLTAEEFRYPLAVAAHDRTVFVADRGLPGVWKIESGRPTVWFRGSKQLRTPLNAVRCLAIDHQGQLLAGDSSTRDVYRFDAEGRPQPLTHGAIGIPMALAVAPDGTIYTADLELHRIWKMPPAGAESPEELAVINSPRGLVLDSEGVLWVLSTSSQHGQILRVDADGRIEPFVKDHPFQLPQSLVRSADGTMFVTDNYGHCIWRVRPDGRCEEWVKGRPLDRPVGLCQWQDDLLIADPHLRTLFRLTPSRELSVFVGPGPSGSEDGDE